MSTSSPVSPQMTSFPASPRILSLPGPPSASSSPAPRQMVSLPPSPLTTSLPPPAQITSSPLVPVRVSLPEVPMIVAASLAHFTDAVASIQVEAVELRTTILTSPPTSVVREATQGSGTAPAAVQLSNATPFLNTAMVATSVPVGIADESMVNSITSGLPAEPLGALIVTCLPSRVKPVGAVPVPVVIVTVPPIGAVSVTSTGVVDVAPLPAWSVVIDPPPLTVPEADPSAAGAAENSQVEAVPVRTTIWTSPLPSVVREITHGFGSAEVPAPAEQAATATPPLSTVIVAAVAPVGITDGSIVNVTTRGLEGNCSGPVMSTWVPNSEYPDAVTPEVSVIFTAPAKPPPGTDTCTSTGVVVVAPSAPKSVVRFPGAATLAPAHSPLRLVVVSHGSKVAPADTELPVPGPLPLGP